MAAPHLIQAAIASAPRGAGRVLNVGSGSERFRSRVGSIPEQFAGRGKAIVLVSHSLADIRRYCSLTVWLEKGRVKLIGAAASVAKEYVFASQAGE